MKPEENNESPINDPINIAISFPTFAKWVEWVIISQIISIKWDKKPFIFFNLSFWAEQREQRWKKTVAGFTPGLAQAKQGVGGGHKVELQWSGKL